MRRDELIIGEKIFDSIYALRTKREEIYDVDKLTNIGETTQDRLIESIRKDGWNSGYRQALEDVLNLLQYKL